jgi:hypothetical protein
LIFIAAEIIVIMDWIRKPSNDLIWAALFIGFLGWFLWAIWNYSVEANSEFIRVKAINGTFKIFWHEVMAIRMNGDFIGFIGSDKRLVASLGGNEPGMQAGKIQLLQFIEDEAEKRHIKIEELEPGEFMPLTHENARE